MRPDCLMGLIHRQTLPLPHLPLHPLLYPPTPSAQAQTSLACISGFGPSLGLKSQLSANRP